MFDGELARKNVRLLFFFRKVSEFATLAVLVLSRGNAFSVLLLNLSHMLRFAE